MDLTNVSPGRREVLERIALFERQRRFDEDVENDPPTVTLLPDKVDYLTKKPKNKLLRLIANAVGDRYFSKLVKKVPFPFRIKSSDSDCAEAEEDGYL